MKLSVFGVILLTCIPHVSVAQTMQAYEQFQDKQSDTRDSIDSGMANVALTAIHVAVGNTLEELRSKDGAIESGEVAICIPKPVAISGDLVAAAISAQAKEYSKNGEIPPLLLQINVTHYAVRGLQNMFPCAGV